MVGKRDRVWTSRLAKFSLFAFLGLGIFLAIAVITIKKLTAAREIPDKAIVAQTAQDQILAAKEPLSSNSSQSVAAHPLDPVLQMARSALENMNATVQDYTAKLEKQERINGELGEAQFMELKVISRSPRPGSTEPFPLHAYFRYVEPSAAAGREVIYVEGKNDNRLVAHESGLMNVMRVNLAPNSFLAMKGNKYPANQVGLENLLKKLIEKGELLRVVENCHVTISKALQWEDRIVDKVEIVLSRKQDSIEFHKAEILFDPALKLPVSYSAYLWPENPQDELELEERYVYHDLKINVGLTEEDFNPDNPKYNFP